MSEVSLKHEEITELIRSATRHVSQRIRARCSYGLEDHGAHVDVLIMTPDGDFNYYCPADGSIICVPKRPWEAT